ncbi:MAG: hypothetical protein QXZ43_03340 [Candidatus Aenigmatarchaeota archaeon]
MILEFLSIIKWLPWVTIFFLFVSAIYHIDVNKILLAIAIFLDLLGYIASFD